MKKEIKDFPHYLISSDGTVYSKNYHLTKQIKKLMPIKDNKGYLNVHLCKDGKQITRRIHRLVAEAFIPNLDNKPQINHKNGIKTDNRIENLEWCTNQENQIHSYRILGKENALLGKLGKLHNLSKIVIQIQNNKVVAEFYGTHEAHRKTGINQQHICECCNGKLKTAGGYQWKYKEKK